MQLERDYHYKSDEITEMTKDGQLIPIFKQTEVL